MRSVEDCRIQSFCRQDQRCVPSLGFFNFGKERVRCLAPGVPPILLHTGDCCQSQSCVRSRKGVSIFHMCHLKCRRPPNSHQFRAVRNSLPCIVMAISRKFFCANPINGRLDWHPSEIGVCLNGHGRCARHIAFDDSEPGLKPIRRYVSDRSESGFKPAGTVGY